MFSRIGRYEIQAELGRGGFGQVFRAYDPTVGRLVAIKTLTVGDDAELIRRFRNEAAAAGKLRHTNIVIIYDFGEHDGSPYLVMELLDGDDLDRIISSRRSLTLLERLDIISQAAAGLHHAHTNGIVHRDIKPANIMLQRDGVVKIMDFGIALLNQATAARLTPKGSMVGTMPYMSPEQFNGAPSDAVTDVFAFGITCYKLLTGFHPFQAEEIGGLMYNIMNRAPNPIRAVAPDCPEALEQAVFGMLQKDRSARYQSLEDVRFDLEPVMAELRRERVNDLLSSARALKESNQIESAQALVRQALDADPANRTARELRETLQRQIRENEVRPRIAALVSEGRADREARRFEEAIKKFVSALKLDNSNAEIHSLIAESRAAMERAELAARLLQNAEQSVAAGNLTAAHGIILHALSTDPHNEKAETLRSTIEQQIETRQRERRLEEGLSHARRLVLLENYDEAIQDLEALAREHQGSNAVRDLLARARTERENQLRRSRLHATIEEAKTLLKNSKFAEAVQRLSAWQKEFPESHELRDLAALAAEELEAEKQAAAVEKAVSETRALVDGRRFDEALTLLRGALGQYPGASALRELMQSAVSAQASHERRTALDQAMAEADEFNRAQRFREASERIAAYVRAYGDSSELDPLRRAADEGLEGQRRNVAIRQLAVDARALLDEGRPDSATQMLQMGTIQFPGHPDLVHLLDEAKKRLKEQQQSEAISRIVSEAESLTRAKHFDRALETIDKGLAEFGANERLERCRQATVATQARNQREHAAREVLDRARALWTSGHLHEAVSEIDRALSASGNDPALLELRQQIAAAQATQQRAEELRKIEAEAASLIGRGEFMSATQILQAADARFPGEDRLTRLHQLAEERAGEQRRASDVSRMMREAKAHADNTRFDKALRLLDAGLRQYPNDRDLTRAHAAIQTAEAEHKRRAELESCKDRARRHRVDGRFDEALDVIASGLKAFSTDNELTVLKEQIEAEREVRRQEDAAQELAKRAESLLARDAASEAVALLDAAREHARRPAIADLLKRARQRIADKQREQAVAAAEREVGRLIASGNFAGGTQVLDKALSQYPGSEQLAQLREFIESARNRAELLSDARQAYQHGQLDKALDLVRQGLDAFPRDTELAQMRSGIGAAIEERERHAAIEQALSAARAHLAKGELKAAADLLRPLTLKYPGEPQLIELFDKAEEQLRHIERERQIASAREQTEALLDQRRFDEALNLLNTRFPGEPRLQTLLARAHELRDTHRRHQAREQARAQLLAIEAKIAQTRRSRLNALTAEARQAAAVHSDDAELKGIADRIEQQVAALLAAPPAAPPKRLPWMWIGVGGAAVAVAAGTFLFLPRSPSSGGTAPAPPANPTVPVEIRTDPQGATVSVGDKTCTTPNCRFDLKPGRYSVSARKKGYLPSEEPLTVEAGSRAMASLTLRPEPPAAPPTGAPRGTIVLRAGVPGARVLVNNVPLGLTDARGEFRAELATGSHSVRVEKGGYKAPSDQSVVISENKSNPLSFSLSPLPSRFEVRGAPNGAEVTLGQSTKRGDGSSVLSFDVQPGQQLVNVSDGKANKQTALKFEPGATVSLDWRDIAPPKPATATPPPVLSADAKLEQDWERVRNTTDTDQLDQFLRDHPNSARTPQANHRLQELVWERTNQSDPKSLQAYLTRFPRGAHAADAQRLFDDANWNSVNKTSAQAVQAYLEANGSSSHRAEAQAIIDRLNGQRQQAEDRRKEAEQLAGQERQGIRSALEAFNNAFVHKSPRELKQAWPGALTDWVESMNQKSAYFVATLYPLGDPEVSGQRATIRCDLITQTIVRGQPQRPTRKTVKVTLRKAGGLWVIEDPRGTE